jgi:hypothetical protein
MKTFNQFINETYYADLTPFTYMGGNRGYDNPVNIGWLEKGEPFEKGDVPDGFLRKLSHAKEDMHTRGWHNCPFCGSMLGTACLIVPGEGKTYIAPNRVDHYIVEHGYKPPQEFIDAVMNISTEKKTYNKEYNNSWGATRSNEEFNLFKKLISPMNKEDDSSSSYDALLQKAFDHKCLYLQQWFGNKAEKLFTGASYTLPYSNGDKRSIYITIHNWQPAKSVRKITPEDPLGEEDWGEGEQRFRVRAERINGERVSPDDPRLGPHAVIKDSPDNYFGNYGSHSGLETDKIEIVIPLLRFIEPLLDTKFDKSNWGE